MDSVDGQSSMQLRLLTLISSRVSMPSWRVPKDPKSGRTNGQSTQAKVRKSPRICS